MNQSIQRDLQQLDKMLANYEKLQLTLEDSELSIPQRQVTEVAMTMLQELMIDKTRDVRRRLREVREY